MRVLAIPNAHALAHVSRLLEIAKVLRARGHEVWFAGHGYYLRVAGWDGFPTRELPYISVEKLVAVSRSQKLWEWFEESELERFIESELALYEEYRPDLVLLDNRVTGRTSAEKAGIKTVAVLNVHMSNYRRIPFYSLANKLNTDHILGLEWLDRVENGIELQFWDRLVMSALNRLRRRMGLRRRYAYEHEEGDLSLFADIPQFSPVHRLPPHACYVGPLTWRNGFPAPGCLDQLRPDQPTVYLSLGSTSLQDLLGADHLLALAQQGVQLVVATGGDVAPRDDLPAGVFLEAYVNTDELLPHCDLVCCHGGNGTLYQALSHGLPVVTVATHEEQHYGGKRIQRLGLGRALKHKTISERGLSVLADALSQVLKEPRYRANAEVFAKHFSGWNSSQRAADEIERHFLGG